MDFFGSSQVSNLCVKYLFAWPRRRNPGSVASPPTVLSVTRSVASRWMPITFPVSLATSPAQLDWIPCLAQCCVSFSIRIFASARERLCGTWKSIIPICFRLLLIQRAFLLMGRFIPPGHRSAPGRGRGPPSAPSGALIGRSCEDRPSPEEPVVQTQGTPPDIGRHFRVRCRLFALQLA